MTIFGLTTQSGAQSLSQSPYSIYGIGDQPLSTLTTHLGMGNTQLALINPSLINAQNPATFAQTTKPLFNFDLKSETLVLDNGASSQSNNLVYLRNLSFAFPLLIKEDRKRNAGLSFGLLPRSHMGYEVLTEDETGLGPTDYSFSGDGGINEMYLGFGFELIRDSGSVNILSIGARGQYVFGSFEQNKYTVFEPSVNASNLGRESQTEISSADANIGVFYSRKLYLNNDQMDGVISFGAYFKPAMRLNASQKDQAFTFENEVNDLSTIDTLTNNASDIRITSPASYGLGVSYMLNNQWMLGSDFSFTQWSALEVDGVNSNLNDATLLTFGAEYTPDYEAKKNPLKYMHYRAGFSFQQTRLNISGAQPLRYGINLGLGIPLLASRSKSVFNIGFEYARREAASVAVAEEYFNLQFGVSIAPSIIDGWFNRRKYD